MASPARASSSSSGEAKDTDESSSETKNNTVSPAQEAEEAPGQGGHSSFRMRLEQVRKRIEALIQRARELEAKIQSPSSKHSASTAPPPTPPPTPPGKEQPGKEQKGKEQTGNEQPGNEQPGNEQPGNEQPGNEQPGNEKPGNEQPDKALQREAQTIPDILNAGPSEARNGTPPAPSQDGGSQSSPPSAANEAAAQAIPPVVSSSLGSPVVVGSNCRSVIVSWPRPGKVVHLGYGNLQMAKDECSKFNGDLIPSGQRKMICGHNVTATLSPAARPDEAPRAERVASQVTVFFGPLPKITDEHLRRSIRKNLTPGPRQVTTGEYTATEAETITAVRLLLETIAPLKLFNVFQDSTKTRLEATVWFPDLVTALRASTELDKKPLPFYPQGELSVRIHHVNKNCSVHCHNQAGN